LLNFEIGFLKLKTSSTFQMQSTPIIRNLENSTHFNYFRIR